MVSVIGQLQSPVTGLTILNEKQVVFNEVDIERQGKIRQEKRQREIGERSRRWHTAEGSTMRACWARSQNCWALMKKFKCSEEKEELNDEKKSKRLKEADEANNGRPPSQEESHSIDCT